MGEEEPTGGFIVPPEVAEYLKRGLDDPQVLKEINEKLAAHWVKVMKYVRELMREKADG